MRASTIGLKVPRTTQLTRLRSVSGIERAASIAVRRDFSVRASSSDAASPSGSDNNSPSPNGPRKGAYAIPTVLKNPGAWFVLAGVLRIVQHCDWGSILSATGVMAHWPWFFMGPAALFTIGPVAIGLGLLANYIIKRNFMENKFFVAGLVGTCALTLWLFRTESYARM